MFQHYTLSSYVLTCVLLLQSQAPSGKAVRLGSSGMLCLRMWGLRITVYRPSRTAGLRTSHLKLIWVTQGFLDSVRFLTSRGGIARSTWHLPEIQSQRVLVCRMPSLRTGPYFASSPASPGKGQMGSALMGSLQISCFLTEGLFGYSR